MGAQAPGRRRTGTPLIPERLRRTAPVDLLAIAVGVFAIAIAAAYRKEFLGDGVRHVSLVLASNAPYLGEPRWLLFPAVLFALLRPLAAAGFTHGVEAALQPFLWTSVASGFVVLWSLRAWLRAECVDAPRRASALLLAGSCAPFLRLYSDIAEPQLAAAMAIAALAFARTKRDDPGRATPALLAAIAAIACAALIYQGVLLALGLVPLVARTATLKQRRVLMALLGAPVAVALTLVLAQALAGISLAVAVQSALGGERNPLMRSFMSQGSLAKYVVALAAGPPQGIVWVPGYGGVPALLAAARGPDPLPALVDVFRLALGAMLVAAMVVPVIRDRDWRAAVAIAALAALPVLRNQQYAYVKFFVLWPAIVAVLAVRFRARHVLLAALLVLAMNGWVLASDVARGRQLYASSQAAYRRASPTSCWMTSGWAPPFHYLWPGTTAGMIATLATGSDPATQARALTASLRDCFCRASDVWTDTASDSAPAVALLAEHFHYDALDLTRLLFDASKGNRVATTGPPVYVYSDAARSGTCRLLSPPADK